MARLLLLEYLNEAKEENDKHLHIAYTKLIAAESSAAADPTLPKLINYEVPNLNSNKNYTKGEKEKANTSLIAIYDRNWNRLPFDEDKKPQEC
jgi:hypothetical protein